MPGELVARKDAIDSVITRVRAAAIAGGRDRRLIEQQRRLSFVTQKELYGSFTATIPSYRRGSRPELEQAAESGAAGARPGLATAMALMAAVSRLEAWASSEGNRPEEQILASAAATAIERARLLAVLAQTMGLASRVCLLYRTAEPAFHAVCELRIMDAWSVFDPLANVVYVMGHHPYATAWELNRVATIVDRHPAHGKKPTVDSSFYRTIGITNVELDEAPDGSAG